MLDVQGVGYEIDVPMSTFYNLPGVGERVTLYTHLIVREDAHLLFGFASESERKAFRQLLKISGVGARTALSLLSGMSVADLVQAVAMQDAGRLTKVPGIGKKTAERLLLELKDKLGAELTRRCGGQPRGNRMPRRRAQCAARARLQRERGALRAQATARRLECVGRNSPGAEVAGQRLTDAMFSPNPACNQSGCHSASHEIKLKPMAQTGRGCRGG